MVGRVARVAMQLAVVVAEKRHLRSGDLRGDPHLYKVVAGSDTEVFKRLDALLAHPFPQLLGGPIGHWIPEHGLGSRIGNGLELQASRGVQLHGKQGLPTVNRHRWRTAQALPEQQPDKRALHERTASRARAMPQRWIAKGRGEQRGLARIHQRLQPLAVGRWRRHPGTPSAPPCRPRGAQQAPPPPPASDGCGIAPRSRRWAWGWWRAWPGSSLQRLPG